MDCLFLWSLTHSLHWNELQLWLFPTDFKNVVYQLHVNRPMWVYLRFSCSPRYSSSQKELRGLTVVLGYDCSESLNVSCVANAECINPIWGRHREIRDRTWHVLSVILCIFFSREDQVNFRGFMRTLAHFRPIEDNEKNKNPPVSEPLNSRTNKLLCECAAAPSLRRVPLESGTFTGFNNKSLMTSVTYGGFPSFFFFSCFPSVWPRQRWQNLTGRAATGERLATAESCDHCLKS